MGFLSRIKSGISSVYKSVDRAVGGYLPGGVAPSSSSSSSSTSTSSSTTSSSGKTTSSQTSGGGGSSGGATVTTTEIKPQTFGVIVTDYTTGESVTTKTTGGRITSQSYSGYSGGGGGSSGTQLGETKALELANRPGGLVQTSTSPKTSDTGLSGGLQPSTVSAYEYTGQPPQRYNRPLGSAIGESFRNVFNFGIIGQQGLGAYTKQAFFEPFEYVGKPKAYKTIGRAGTPDMWEAAYNFGMTKPGTYRMDSTNPPDITGTYFEYSEAQKKKLYGEAGLSYKGEPARILTFKVGESIVKELTPKYQTQLEKGIKEQRDYYQAKVDTGEFTLSQAETSFKSASQAYTNVVNTQFQREAQSIYESRVSGLSPKIQKVEAFQSKIFEPPAYPIIRTTGRVIETGAIVGATAFGGSGLTLAASAYIGAKTAKQSVEYAGAYDQLTTKQKIIGGAGITLGAAATVATFNLGVTKFYSEWRGIIYSDLAKTPGTIRGAEVLRTKELARYNIASLKQQGTSKALTVQRVDVYPTGADRAGFFAKGVTKTKIFDPQYEKYVTTTQKFTTSGYIPNIKEGSITLGSKGLAVTSAPEWSTGVGQAKYITSSKVTDYRFISAAKDTGKYYTVAAGRSPQRAFSVDLAPGVKAYSTSVRGAVEGTGKILKLQDYGTSNLIITSGKKSSEQFFRNLYGTGASVGVQTTKQAQAFSLSSLAAQTSKVSAGGAATLQLSKQILTPPKASQNVEVRQTQPQRLVSYQLPALSQMLPQRQEQRGALATSSSFGIASIPALAQIPTVNQATIQSVSQLGRQRQALRLSTLTPVPPFSPGFFQPPTPSGKGFIPPFYFDLSPGGSDLFSRVLKGGKKVTGYTPSFSALVFNIRGSYKSTGLAKSGIDFRPITPGFSFLTGGRRGFSFKKLLRI